MLKSFSAQTNALGALNYKGTWDATANSPALASGVGTKGDYYVVSVAGSTTLDGISNWGIGDWAVFNGAVWQRVEGGADLNGVNLTVSNNATIGGVFSFSSDVNLNRDAADILAQRRGTTAQAFRVYNTFTDASNFERGAFQWSSNSLQIGTERGGTGTSRNIQFVVGNAQVLNLSSTGNLLWNTDNTFDIGASGANRPRNVYVASQLTTPSIAAISNGYISFGAEGRFTHAGSDGVFRLQNNAVSGATLQFGGFSSSFPALKRNSTALETKLADDSAYAPHAMQYLDITDGITAPAAATGRARIYVDTADGDLKVIFADGTIKTIVTDT